MKWQNLAELQAFFKEKRAFDVSRYIDEKVARINNFFKTNNLDSAVIGISGGVDSATALALLLKAQRQSNSPIRKILPLVVPIFGSGVTRQQEVKEIACRFLHKCCPKYFVFDLTSAYRAIVNEADSISLGKITGYDGAWEDGQMASVLRTPVFYYYAAILQANGYKSLVVGTTNRDEGSYIGFFGKASDGMVDLQPIADIHKSEVYQVAKALEVSEEILTATPSGDVWDGKCDEEMIGAPYHFIETYLQMKELGFDSDVTMKSEMNLIINEEDRLLFEKWATNIEKKHQQNFHKYQVGSPAHFIDVMSRKIPGGW